MILIAYTAQTDSYPHFYCYNASKSIIARISNSSIVLARVELLSYY